MNTGVKFNQIKKYLVPLIFVTLSLIPFAISDTATTAVNIGNSLPVASSVTIAAGNLNGGEVELTSNQTTQINITATITDYNGCTDIDSVNATFFRTNITGGSNAADNNRTHYSMDCTVQAGTCTGDSDSAADYDCKVNVTWYADPTDSGSKFAGTNWTVNVTPYDTTGIGTSDSTIYDLKTLTSFNLIDTSINFGSLSLGQNTTTTNQDITLENLGNEGIDISFTGYGATQYDNYSMNCTLGEIPIDYLEYSASSFTYGAGNDLSNSTTELDFDLDRGNDTTTRPQKDSFYGLKIPTEGVGGSCSGNVVITATSDPSLD